MISGSTGSNHRSSTCTTAPATLDTGKTVPAPAEVLCEIVRRYGTPTYAYNIARIRVQVAKLRTHFPSSIEILYSLKANPSLGLSGVLAECGLGADVASAGEMAIALAAGFAPQRIFLTGPDRLPRRAGLSARAAGHRCFRWTP